MNKFTVFYSDKTHFSGDPLKNDWKLIDDTKKIVKFIYILGDKCIVMEGFKQYNHFKEKLGLQAKGISKILLMGRRKKDTLIITFDLVGKKIFKRMVPYGEEYGKQILAGWQNGLLTKPNAYFKKLKNEKQK